MSLSHEQHQIDTRLIVKMTGSAAQWKQFAVVDSNGVSVGNRDAAFFFWIIMFQNTLASVNMNQKPSAPFCCFESEADMGLFGEYGIISDPIEVIDSRTLKIPKFSYKASQTPGTAFYTWSYGALYFFLKKPFILIISWYNGCNLCQILNNV